MAAYLFNLDPKGWILIEEQYSDPHKVEGYSKEISEEEAKKAIEKIEEKIGYELLGKKEMSSMTKKQLKNTFVRTAGFDEDGNFVTGEGMEEYIQNIKISEKEKQKDEEKE